MLNKNDAIEIAKRINDPEIGIDIYTLGLIYHIKLKNKNSIKIIMTLTSPMCPFGQQIIDEFKLGLTKAGFKNPEIELTFDPIWEPSDELRAILGI